MPTQYAAFDPTATKTAAGVVGRLHQPKKQYHSEVFVEPDRRLQIERAVAARERARHHARPFNGTSRGNTHNATGTFSEFAYLHAKPRPDSAPAHTHAISAAVAAHNQHAVTLNARVPHPPSTAPAAAGAGAGAAGAGAGKGAVPKLDFGALTLTNRAVGAVEQESARAKRMALPDTDGCPRVHQGVTSIRRRYVHAATSRPGRTHGGTMHAPAPWAADPFTDRPLTYVHRHTTRKGVQPFRHASGGVSARAPVGFSAPGALSARELTTSGTTNGIPHPSGGGDIRGRTLAASALQGVFDRSTRRMAPDHTQEPVWMSATKRALLPLRAAHARPFKGGHAAATIAKTDFISGHAAPAHLPEDYDSSQRAWAARSLHGYAGENGFRPKARPGHAWRHPNRMHAPTHSGTTDATQMRSVQNPEVTHQHNAPAISSSAAAAAATATVAVSAPKPSAPVAAAGF